MSISIFLLFPLSPGEKSEVSKRSLDGEKGERRAAEHQQDVPAEEEAPKSKKSRSSPGGGGSIFDTFPPKFLPPALQESLAAAAAVRASSAHGLPDLPFPPPPPANEPLKPPNPLLNELPFRDLMMAAGAGVEKEKLLSLLTSGSSLGEAKNGPPPLVPSRRDDPRLHSPTPPKEDKNLAGLPPMNPSATASVQAALAALQAGQSSLNQVRTKTKDQRLSKSI